MRHNFIASCWRIALKTAARLSLSSRRAAVTSFVNNCPLNRLVEQILYGVDADARRVALAELDDRVEAAIEIIDEACAVDDGLHRVVAKYREAKSRAEEAVLLAGSLIVGVREKFGVDV